MNTRSTATAPLTRGLLCGAALLTFSSCYGPMPELDAPSQTHTRLAREHDMYVLASTGDEWQKGLHYPYTTWWYNEVTVCFHRRNNDDAEFRQRVDDLVASSWERYAHIDFVGFEPCTEAAADIQIAASSAWKAASMVGTIATQPDTCQTDEQCQRWHGRGSTCDHGYCPTMWLPTWSSDFEIIHEFGHALGLVHEHLRDEYGNGTTECELADDDRVEGLYYFDPAGKHGDYDEDSIMNYCGDREPQLSPGDIATVQALYPHDYPLEIAWEGWGWPAPYSVTVAHDAGTRTTWLADLEDGSVTWLAEVPLGSNFELSFEYYWSGGFCHGDLEGTMPEGGLSPLPIYCYSPAQLVSLL